MNPHYMNTGNNIESGPPSTPPSMSSAARPGPLPGQPSVSASERWHQFNRMFNHRLDKLNPYWRERWAVYFLLFLIFVLRVVLLHGFYIIAYAYGIYSLNLTIGFLSPAVDPELDFEIPPEETAEFRPFVRRLPEFKFWWACFKWLSISVFSTLIPALDLPVFWPILVAYFFILCFITMKDRVKHMIKYRYVPWTTGKKKHIGILPSTK